ncbi:MAG: hypothetical protein K8R54_10230 [Bacteroidales bacterium]|nr:hypothetical protein [Bacteroidales bacterium]
MTRFLIIILLLPIISKSQNNSDYEIYSLLISENIDYRKLNTDTIAHIIITDNLTKFSRINSIPLDLLTKNNYKLAYELSDYNEKIFDLAENNKFDKLVKDFESKLNYNTGLIADSFNLDITVKIIDNRKIEKLFDSKIEQAWRKFYKKNPSSPGYFEFSKIGYYKNYAIVYFVQRAKPLLGSGSLEILFKEDNKWNKFLHINIWAN